jgi:hypothetical protein
MERDFMAKLDSNAAEALVSLEAGLPEKEWASTARTSWSRFLVAQMLRTPRDIAKFKSSVGQEWNKSTQKFRESYAASQSANDPATFDEYLARQNFAHADECALKIARMLMEHTELCHLLNEMHWCVLNVPQDCYPLLTSDHPVWMTATFTEDDAFLMMAIGPRRLFTATVRIENLDFERKLEKKCLHNVYTSVLMPIYDNKVSNLMNSCLPQGERE